MSTEQYGTTSQYVAVLQQVVLVENGELITKLWTQNWR